MGLAQKYVMSDLLLIMVAEAVPITGGILYALANYRARHRLRNARFAGALLTEIRTIHKEFKEIMDDHDRVEKDPQKPGQVTVSEGPFDHIFLRNVYDGLVASSNIAYFDRDIQENLHRMYVDIEFLRRLITRYERGDVSGWHIPRGKEWADGILHNMDGVVQMVTDFHTRNQCRSRWCHVLKAIRLAYDD